MSIFSNEDPTGRSEENFAPDSLELAYPDNMRRFNHLLDLLMVDELVIQDPVPEQLNLPEIENTDIESTLPGPDLTLLQDIGPFPFVADNNFRFFDLERDAFVLLPDSYSDFQQTNRALERSAEHRLLFTGRWRQPVLDPGQAQAIYIAAGVNYGEFHELEGSITIRFNDNRDRVVIDTNLWLVEPGFVESDAPQWSVPAARDDLAYPETMPGSALGADSIRHVYAFRQSREMRSTEFHYLDHPALGLVITVDPYELPPPPVPLQDPFAPRLEPLN